MASFLEVGSVGRHLGDKLCMYRYVLMRLPVRHKTCFEATLERQDHTDSHRSSC